MLPQSHGGSFSPLARKIRCADVIELICIFISRCTCLDLQKEGLFRHCSNERRKRSLVTAVNERRVAAELSTGVYSEHDVADVIKLYIKKLPEPLLTQRHNGAYAQIQGRWRCCQSGI